jgi:hypothetical protein
MREPQGRRIKEKEKMHIRNETNDQHPVKVCLYNVSDKLQAIPVGAGVFTVQAGENHQWDAVPGEGQHAYHIKVFHPQLLDSKLCDLNNAVVDDSFVVRGAAGSYSVTKV